MPFIVPFIPLIAAAATAGTSIGLYEANKGDASDAAAQQQKQLQQEQLQQVQQNELSKQKAIQANVANAQEQGGGALTSPGLANLASIIAGFPGGSGDSASSNALASYLGTGSGGTSSGTGNDNLVGATYGLSGSQG